jgi:hypothetical protein
VIAAEAAALQWAFDPNFGFPSSDGLHFNYAQGVLLFDFVLDEPKKGASKDATKKYVGPDRRP